MKIIPITVIFAALGYFTLQSPAQTFFVPQPREAFSAETNYMSVPGYLRWQNYLATGNWNCQGRVKLTEEYIDDQEGDGEATSGMDIRSVTPQKVHYSLRVNKSPTQNLLYQAHAVRREGIYGDVIRIDWDYEFCIGPEFHYSLSRFIAINGLLDKVGNRLQLEGKRRTQTFRFHLEYNTDGGLAVIDEVGKQKGIVPYKNGVFFFPGLRAEN